MRTPTYGADRSNSEKCALCGDPRVTDSDFCWGCKSHVCSRCDQAKAHAATPFGPHKAEDHKYSIGKERHP